MKAGDTVRVYPHAKPDLSATATVALISSNGRSIALVFEDKPLFALSSPGMIIGGDGIVMLATRVELNGKPWGPWVEVFAQGHFEIEEMPQTTNLYTGDE